MRKYFLLFLVVLGISFDSLASSRPQRLVIPSFTGSFVNGLLSIPVFCFDEGRSYPKNLSKQHIYGVSGDHPCVYVDGKSPITLTEALDPNKGVLTETFIHDYSGNLHIEFKQRDLSQKIIIKGEKTVLLAEKAYDKPKYQLPRIKYDPNSKNYDSFEKYVKTQEGIWKKQRILDNLVKQGKLASFQETETIIDEAIKKSTYNNTNEVVERIFKNQNPNWIDIESLLGAQLNDESRVVNYRLEIISFLKSKRKLMTDKPTTAQIKTGLLSYIDKFYLDEYISKNGQDWYSLYDELFYSSQIAKDWLDAKLQSKAKSRVINRLVSEGIIVGSSAKSTDIKEGVKKYLYNNAEKEFSNGEMPISSPITSDLGIQSLSNYDFNEAADEVNARDEIVDYLIENKLLLNTNPSDEQITDALKASVSAEDINGLINKTRNWTDISYKLSKTVNEFQFWNAKERISGFLENLHLLDKTSSTTQDQFEEALNKFNKVDGFKLSPETNLATLGLPSWGSFFSEIGERGGYTLLERITAFEKSLGLTLKDEISDNTIALAKELVAAKSLGGDYGITNYKIGQRYGKPYLWTISEKGIIKSHVPLDYASMQSIEKVNFDRLLLDDKLPDNIAMFQIGAVKDNSFTLYAANAPPSTLQTSSSDLFNRIAEFVRSSPQNNIIFSRGEWEQDFVVDNLLSSQPVSADENYYKSSLLDEVKHVRLTKLIEDLQVIFPEKTFYIGGKNIRKDLRAIRMPSKLTQKSDVGMSVAPKSFEIKYDFIDDLKVNFSDKGFNIYEFDVSEVVNQNLFEHSNIILLSGHKNEDFIKYVNELKKHDLYDKTIVMVSCGSRADETIMSELLNGYSGPQSIVYFPDKLQPDLMKKFLQYLSVEMESIGNSSMQEANIVGFIKSAAAKLVKDTKSRNGIPSAMLESMIQKAEVFSRPIIQTSQRKGVNYLIKNQS